MRQRLKVFGLLCSRHQNSVAFLLFALLALFFFWPALIKGNAMLAYDYVTQFYPSRSFYKESLLSGEFPLWCPYPGAGTFFATNSSHSCFYPLTACFIIFPVTYGFAVYGAIHITLFAFFIYMLAKECGISYYGSLIAGLAAFVAGMPLSEMEFPEMLGGLAWSPAILLCFLRLLKNTNRRNMLVLALVCAMQVLSGSPYPPFYTLVSMIVIGACHVLFQKLSAKETCIKIAHAFGAAVIAFFLCAPQLVPMLKLFREARAYGREGLLPASFSMRPIDWLPALVPNSMGYDDNFKCFYLGLLPLMLAGVLGCWILCRIFACKTNSSEPEAPHLKRVAVVFGLLASIGLVASLGGYISLDKLIDKIPIISRCNRWPSWIGFLFVLGTTILAGAGFDALMASRKHTKYRRLVLPFFAAAILAGFILLVFRNDMASILDAIRKTYWFYMHSSHFMAEVYNLAHYPATQVVLRFSLFLIAAAGLLTLCLCTKLKPLMLFLLLACCLIADKALFYSTRAISHTSKVDIYNEVPEAVTFFKSQMPANIPYRVYIPKTLDQVSLIALFSRRVEDYQFIRSRMIGGVAMQSHISTNNNLVAFREGAFEYILIPWLESLDQRSKDQALGLWNFKYAFDISISAKGQLQYNLREISNFQPRAWLSYAAYPVEKLQDALALMTSTSFKPREVLLPVQPGLAARRLTGAPGTADIQTISYTNNSVTITATAERDAYLYLSDSYESGWRAFLDGKKTDVYKANMNGRAVAFPAGTHTVHFKYSPPSFWIGLWAGMAAWIAVGAFFLHDWKKRRNIVNEPANGLA